MTSQLANSRKLNSRNWHRDSGIWGLHRQEILVSRVSSFQYAKNALNVGSSEESQPLIYFGDLTSDFSNLGFAGLRNKTLDYRIREIAKSDIPKCKGGIPQGYLWVQIS